MLSVPYKSNLWKMYDKQRDEVETEDFVYKTYPDGRKLSISVDHAMNVEGPAPVMFFFHGGAWQKGGRTSHQSYTKTLARKYGVTCVRVQYSLIKKDSDLLFENLLEDCRDAVQYVIDHAAELNADPERIGFKGSSAGGHLAAATALSFPQTKLLEGDFGPYDLKYLFDKIPAKSIIAAPFRNATKKFNIEYIKSVSPYYMAKAPVNFAVLLFQGGCDTVVPAEIASAFRDKLMECGATNVELVLYPYGTHALNSGMYGEDWFNKSTEAILKYLK